MNKLKIVSIILLIISTIAILYGLIFNPADWIVITIAIIFIPFFILSFGLLSMAKPKKDEKEERIQEPFIGY
ncbi:SND2/TMEM208 family protein [uncultured Methanobrevibacter sp.]|uniref:SND2/TMEM208 family protein n=1 Tax=uncultured Methanobrevibacter sp. TaxID=253161 RepID=UPI0025F4AD0F|nr:SND2/TMEM208 family protein [uncultured Methanobrevibacter sp.]